jgi:hypothetical protein
MDHSCLLSSKLSFSKDFATKEVVSGTSTMLACEPRDASPQVASGNV